MKIERGECQASGSNERRCKSSDPNDENESADGNTRVWIQQSHERVFPNESNRL